MMVCDLLKRCVKMDCNRNHFETLSHKHVGDDTEVGARLPLTETPASLVTSTISIVITIVSISMSTIAVTSIIIITTIAIIAINIIPMTTITATPKVGARLPWAETPASGWSVRLLVRVRIKYVYIYIYV